MKRFLPLAALSIVLVGCSSSSSESAASKEPPKEYKIRGVVQRLDPPNLAVIKHQKIEGWMEAMTMEFPFKDPRDYNQVKNGACIEGTVFVQGNDFWVGNVSNVDAAPEVCVPPAAPPPPPNDLDSADQKK